MPHSYILPLKSSVQMLKKNKSNPVLATMMLLKSCLWHYWQSSWYIKWHESALDCVRPEPPSVDYYGYQQTSQAILWDGLQKSREVAAAVAASMAQEGDNCGKKWRSFVSRSTGSAAAALEEILSSRRLCRLGQSWKLISNYGSLIHTVCPAVFSRFFFLSCKLKS